MTAKTAKKQATKKPIETPIEDELELTQDGERVDPYVAVVEGNGTPLAPRLSAAWEGIQQVLADGEAHTLSELMDASGGLAENTVRQLLKAAVNAVKVLAIDDGRAARRGSGRIARKYRLIEA